MNCSENKCGYYSTTFPCYCKAVRPGYLEQLCPNFIPEGVPSLKERLEKAIFKNHISYWHLEHKELKELLNDLIDKVEK